ITETPPLTSSAAVQTGCPTVTATRELCTTCAVPACLALATVTQSCGCPTPVPTVQLDFPCASGCGGLWCSTSYAIVTVSDCPGESTAITLAPNATVSRPRPSGTSSTPSSSTTASANGAGMMRVPFRLW
ncbi:hypothetical protein BT67DRAFT_389927, partial [Trichocladium antarcticum]